MSKKVSDFDAATPLAGDELVGIVQGGDNARTTTADIAALASVGSGSGGVVTPQDFGAVADGVTDDGPAFAAAIAYLKANAVNDITIYKGSPRLFVPAGDYFMGTTTLDITHTLIIEGEGTGLAGGSPSKLTWDVDTTGIRIQRANTSGVDDVDIVLHSGGDATIIQNLQLAGAFTDGDSEGEFHGIMTRSRVLIRDCFLTNWQGDGIHLIATAGGGSPVEGNANQFQIERTTAWYCRTGCYLDGADANAGYTMGCDFSYCRQWGLWDNSFLGNNHSNHHSANCGFADNGISAPPYAIPTIVSHNGHIYYVKAGQEAWCSANAPTGAATSNQGWLYLREGAPFGASIPAYAAATEYRTGGPYRVGENDPANDGNQSVTMIGLYAEGGSAPPQFGASGTLLIGGIWGTGVGGWAGYIYGNSIGVHVAKNLSVGQSLFANSGQNYLGSTIVANTDTNLHLQNTGATGNWINFETWDGAGAQLYDDGYILGETAIGLVFNGRSTTQAHRFRANGTNIFKVSSTGLDIFSGKTLLVNGTQVLTAQQAAIADPTDAASTQARLIDVLAALRTHGIIAT